MTGVPAMFAADSTLVVDVYPAANAEPRKGGLRPDLLLLHYTGMRSAAVLGFSSAIAAYGAFFIPKSFGTSIELTGGPQAALYIFIGFYLSCIAVTWWYYSRKNAPVPC